ncbi:flagellar biosynthesis protein FlhB [Variovorax arabinosiphilus]|uniref:flagellar biosynthesis protein FlhB n=1 Tax=Variovorax arabinosiphilus TaxID=3053498 RepID=UPI002574B728|nr:MULTISPECIES: flagellar biosynthesis protein FlhB [unclassified Variovorax]MDM0118198.1 flagellar biosynthesis protein FlhB [Variovorax sp. J2L1-78]MDM0128623.1 flagellar biosynthesis protein FlhB [Variovorax sp. J2L1-63]MDM0233591.1 flagellar biosynthesis protein FlhB [Variovorax sp. J2R1-6]
MSEESDLEKTEEASPRRLEKAREDGDVARSRELVTLVILGAGISGLWLTSSSLGTTFGGALQHGLQFDRKSAFDASHMLTQAGSMVLEGLLAIAPFFGMMMLAALVGPIILGGWLFSTKAIAPNFGKLNPLAGIGRMFSTQSLAELTKALAKSLLVGLVAWWVISGHVGDMVALMGEPAHRALPHAIRMIVVDCAVIAATLVIVAMIDVPYQLWSHAKKLRMSREDLRQEHKESEGDPHVKANIRRMQQQVAKRRMMAEVPKADIVVTNPTHFAVALKYRDGDMRAPRVVAKGSDLVAQRIRELAKEHNVAVLEAPPLTRALFKHTRLGDEIPAGLYTAVAEVLAWVYQLKRWKDEGGDAPRTPTDLPVPSELQYNVSAA